MKKVVEIPYEDQVTFYGNPSLKKLIYSKISDRGKGWNEVQVGKEIMITRNSPHTAVQNLLDTHYPNYKRVSLFNSLSYHSPKNKKLEKYGTHKYNLSYSELDPIGTYSLELPVKSQKKQQFGRIVKKVPLYKWDYSVIDWNVGSKGGLQLKRQISSPFEDVEKKLVFKSKIVPVSKSNILIKKLKQMIKKY